MDEQNNNETYKNPLNRIFDLIGWISFLLMVPPILGLAGIPVVSEFLSKNIGPWASTEYLVAYFLGFQLLRVFFGSARLITPLIIALLSTGLQLSLVFSLGFMSWFYSLVEQTHFYAGKASAAAIILVFQALSYFLSSARRIPAIIQIIFLVLIPVGGIIALEVTGANQAILAFLNGSKQ